MPERLPNMKVARLLHLQTTDELTYAVSTGQVPGIAIPKEANGGKNKVRIFKEDFVPWYKERFGKEPDLGGT